MTMFEWSSINRLCSSSRRGEVVGADGRSWTTGNSYQTALLWATTCTKIPSAARIPPNDLPSKRSPMIILLSLLCWTKNSLCTFIYLTPNMKMKSPNISETSEIMPISTLYEKRNRVSFPKFFVNSFRSYLVPFASTSCEPDFLCFPSRQRGPLCREVPERT
jgi:hypothetical protein